MHSAITSCLSHECRFATNGAVESPRTADHAFRDPIRSNRPLRLWPRRDAEITNWSVRQRLRLGSSIGTPLALLRAPTRPISARRRHGATHMKLVTAILRPEKLTAVQTVL